MFQGEGKKPPNCKCKTDGKRTRGEPEGSKNGVQKKKISNPINMNKQFVYIVLKTKGEKNVVGQ